MATLSIAGDYTSALTHFALYGLSLMVEQKHPGTVTVGWSQEGQPRAQMHADGVSEEEIAECVHSYGSSVATVRVRKLLFSPRSHRVFEESTRRSTRTTGLLTRRPDRLIWMR